MVHVLGVGAGVGEALEAFVALEKRSQFYNYFNKLKNNNLNIKYKFKNII
jgi:hypothetical protein